MVENSISLLNTSASSSIAGSDDAEEVSSNLDGFTISENALQMDGWIVDSSLSPPAPSNVTLFVNGSIVAAVGGFRTCWKGAFFVDARGPLARCLQARTSVHSWRTIPGQTLFRKCHRTLIAALLCVGFVEHTQHHAPCTMHQARYIRRP